MSTDKTPGISAASKPKLYLALSRTPHGLLDLAAPSLAALLWLGSLPPPVITLLGLITMFAGYYPAAILAIFRASFIF